MTTGPSRLLWLPPPGVVALTAIMMWLTEQQAPVWTRHFAGQQSISGLLLLVGLSLMGLAASALFRAGTTVLPFNPGKSRRLVTGGIFRYSRNPIYLGDILLLLAWAVWLGNGLGLLWLPLFVGYMNKVQIGAEERALAARFGADYLDYCRRVRRWL
ncbi:protein-S-isoprenylcysteine O-methyltransferase Ste14 [Oceanisphaera litoralis]|uniref:methyltransferase family protein n=1 Tax=Oceanisphaera litoralis TaxID=225144 RepID=UPI001EF96A5F|nr:isoprenylcysteine carboxylmethyltransferase family protein [Oceanisphaera litoralis]MBM7454554.1 protein-S-isoprenylcysteine O-methyltransferase Ste14 [Oceanisphaera litoralis]